MGRVVSDEDTGLTELTNRAYLGGVSEEGREGRFCHACLGKLA